MNLPADIFTGDHYDKYLEHVEDVMSNLKSKEAYDKTLGKWRSRFMHRRMPP